jgi:ferritin-like metal-binding protein YciE
MATSKTKSTASKSTKSNATKTGGMQKGAMLEEFMVETLKDLYWAEKHLIKALGKMIKSATTEELKSAFDEHKTQTETHVTRLDKAFEMMGRKSQAKKCEAMEGLTKEAESIIEETEKGTMTRDVALIIAAQKVEHYEIATYGGLVQLAKTTGMEDMAELLQETLDEEKETDQLLTQIAENNLNWEAEQEEK